MMTEAETGVMYLQAKEHQGLFMKKQKPEEARKNSYLQGVQGKHRPADTLFSEF